MRDGWSAAESRAKKEEIIFKKSENRFLRLALRFSEIYRSLGLRVSEVETRFTRRNYENIQLKSQVLTTMLQNPKIHPKLAFIHCGMFPDPDAAYEMSMEYAEEQEKKAEEKAKKLAQTKEGDGNNDPVDE